MQNVLAECLTCPDRDRKPCPFLTVQRQCARTGNGPRKIDRLKELLESQEPFEEYDWEKTTPEIKVDSDDKTMDLLVRELQIGFCFDETGDKFLGMYNWKD